MDGSFWPDAKSGMTSSKKKTFFITSDFLQGYEKSLSVADND
jgi:hypothetical protein